MSAERLEILGMLRDQVISVEDAERLLRALDEGERRREHESQSSRGRDSSGSEASGSQSSGCGSWGGGSWGGWGSRRGRRWSWGDVGHVGTDVIQEVLSGLGPTVKDVVDDAMEGFGVGWKEEIQKKQPVALDDDGFALPEGASLFLRNDKSHEGATLLLEGSDGERCELELEEGQKVRVSRHDLEYALQWDHGVLRVKVPRHIKGLQAMLLGGSIRLKRLEVPVKLKAMGGNIHLKAVAGPFQARTMGGNIHLSLAEGWRGKGRAETMGGLLTVELPEEIEALVTAETIGGAIVAEDLGALERVRSMMFERAHVELGQAPSSQLHFKSTGGEIHLGR